MRSFLNRLRALFSHGRVEREMSEEMRHHIDLESAELARTRGLPPGEARREALIAFGGVARYEEEHRDARGTRWLEDLGRDLRYAARSLGRSPAFTISAALVLALGIGSTTAIFSAVDTVLVSRLPYPRDEQLVRIFEAKSPTNRWNASVADVRGIEAQQHVFSDLGAVRGREAAFSAGGEPRQMIVEAATAGFFRALELTVARGRLPGPRDDAPGAPGVAVVSHELAERDLGGADAALGRAVTIDGLTYTVVGVLAPGVHDLAGVRSEVWSALPLETATRRGPFSLFIFARLKDGVTLDAARRDLSAVSDRLLAQWTGDFHDASARLTPYPLRQVILRDAPRTLGIFAVAVGFVLLIAIANVASLMLVRVTGRAREIALRAVLGASRSRIARLLVTESMGLAALGTALGLALAWSVLRALTTMGPDIPRLSAANIDLRAFAFAALVGLATGALIGIYPVLSLFRGALAPALRGGDREVGAGRGTHALRGLLVTAQFALALPLLAGAGLLLNSFLRLQRVDVGFDPSHVLYVSVSLPAAAYRDLAATSTFWTRAIARVRETPGIVDAGVNTDMPSDDAGNKDNFDWLDQPVPSGTSEPVSVEIVADAGFFAAARIPLLEGRLFSIADSASAPQAMIVSRSWAHRYSPDRPVLGRQLFQGGCRGNCPPATIIGVVGDVKYEGLAGTGEAMYDAASQNRVRVANLFVRTAGPPADAIERVRTAIRSIDPTLALNVAGAVSDRVTGSIASQRNWTTLLGGFAAAALALAAVGIFGMLSYLVTARRREIGVRIALGARRREILSMILNRGMRYALPGAFTGLVVALLAGRWLSTLLYDVGAADPLTLGATTVLLLSVALLACYLPARRAASVTPMQALRED